jgi:hypothetical protein
MFIKEKSIFRSKTFWVAIAIAALTAYSPWIKELLKEHTTLATCSISFVFAVLRLITKSPVKLK